MTIEQKIFSKLEPHAKRIQNGDGNDFDYLPAVLLQLMEEQKRQAKLLDDSAKLLDSLKSTADTVGVQNKAQIKSLADGIQQSHVKLMRLLIAGLVTSTVMIGLAVAILQRH